MALAALCPISDLKATISAVLGGVSILGDARAAIRKAEQIRNEPIKPCRYCGLAY